MKTIPFLFSIALSFLLSCSLSPEETSFLNLVNDHRESVGCEPLTHYSKLSIVAQAHSRDMQTNNVFSHTTL